MSELETRSSAPPRRRRLLRITAGGAIGLAAIVSALALWLGSDQCQNMVRLRLAKQLQNATGGRVEIASFHWRPLHLEAEAGGVVIHGDEAPTDAPYARVEHLRVRLSLVGLWSPRIRLRELEIEKPQFHLIFYRDGATNQPHPARPPKPGRSGLDTLFDLHAGRIAVEQGIIDLDDRAAELDVQNRYEPLDFQGNDVSVVLKYVAANGRTPESYHIDTAITDLRLERGGSLKDKVPPLHGIIRASIDLMRDTARLNSMTVTSATRGVKDQTLEIKGGMQHFAHPSWQATIKGDLDMRLLDPVLGYPFVPEGIARVDLTSAGEDGKFRFDGSVHATKAAYVGTGVVARGIDLTARVHADPLALRITSVAVRLQQGGEMTGEVLLDHWLPVLPGPVLEAPPAEAPGAPAPSRRRFGIHLHSNPPPPRPVPPAVPPHSTLVKHPVPDLLVNGKVNAEFRNVTLDTILQMVSQPPFQRLGINALVNGPADAVWTHGDVNTLAVKAMLNLAPGVQMVPNEAPATGTIDATYTQRDGAVDVRTLDLNLPASHFGAHGRLGAYPLTSPTELDVDFKSGNLGEFDTVFRALGLTRNGKSGVAALPVSLRGEGEFHGTWAGSLISPRLAGHLLANQIAVEIPARNGPPQTIRWDSIEADGSYDAEHIAIVHGQLRHGPAQIVLDGSLEAAALPAPVPKPTRARARSLPRPDELPAFSVSSVMHAHVRATHIGVGDLLPLTGLNLPVSGTLDAQFAADGPVDALGGSGWAQLNDGIVYGEPVASIRAQGSLQDHLVKLNSFTINEKAGSASGSGSYDLEAQRLQLDAHGTAIDIAKIERLRSLGGDVAGRLEFAVSVSGTRNDPKLDGRASLAGFSIQGQPMGALNVTAHTTGHTLVYNASTGMESAAVSIDGQTDLRDDYPTQAKLEFSNFDIGTVLKLEGVQGITAKSALAGTAAISGPLAHPDGMRGELRLQQLAVTVSGVHLKSDAGVHASLADARVSLDPVHITGEDTDLRAQGTLGLRDTRRLDFAASGSVNLKLAETIDPDLTAGGTSTFQVEAHGPLSNPGLRGRIEFQNGSLALEDLPNGLSQLHGRLEFNQNRLEVKSLTAMTGGGQLSVGGYLAYQHGIFADLTVTGRGVRIRYPEGVSSLADADLQLQGTQSSLLLSGKVLITRFSVSPDIDIAALASQATTAQTVAPPNAPSNHVRLEVRIQSSPQLNFQNAYAKLAGDVDLRLRGTVASPTLLGRISITEGNAIIAGTRYELQRGDVTFTNPVRIQPMIDLNASARVEDYDITLGLHGTPDKMSVTYRSDPPLPEADVVALLALGRTQSEQGLYTQQQQQSAGLSPSTDVLLGGALNATVSSRVQKLFGAGSVKVDPSYLGALGNSTTRITVEEQLGKNVTLTYATNVDTSAQQLLQAEIAINRHVSVQVTRDESGVFSMVIKAIRRYR